MEITVSVILRFIAYGILVFYIGCLLMIFFYSLTQLNMLRYFLKYIKQKKRRTFDSKKTTKSYYSITYL